ncbi:xanthine dehydrogenase accessory factor [Agrobacterium tumefaciens]|uniref:Xanthine dehydrogenase accessory factor n=1 Tax=Agrobacterium radiobacter TaxID=362 RepID=A0ABR6JDZ3_AGRRD|nr:MULTISPECIES: XdhC family protein [Agrobacterium tumefaciens complex]MBB4321218.1 xanthine dehydrogenase accessory factor [Agrobacterium radiobacter]MBB4338258.1 xanthine dehydrogenase accessory factor [Agrobacterium radiobacter]MBB4493146.1 xanthine dehydrogenase accessory factor [Agrobacterium radiobacter]MBB4498419.1 xanthine dehydrogenase accessory factor [Agrobacterium radiobacter]MBB4503882.1 xanthine dehydrogenase accessory factor [Agrobacterium radiobacter]
MDLSTLERLNACRRTRVAAALVTDLDSGKSSVIAEGDELNGALGEAVASAFRSRRSSVAEIDGGRYFLNIYLPPPDVVIIGAVHISQVLAQMGTLAGFSVRIIDPRTAFATPDRFAGIDLAADWPSDALKEKPLDAYTALVAVTHDPKIDDFPIAEALRRGCFYVGALGSRRTHASRLVRLRAEGFADEALTRINGPVGLPIGASSPAEIAVAILAQIIEALRTRNIGSRKGDIQ